MTTTILSHALTGALICALLGAVYSTCWYAVRRSVWGDLPIARLPLGARIAQAIAEALTNLPGAVRAVVASSATPGAQPERPTMTPPPPGAS